MTDAEIDALPAGRELDALVAEKVMGHLVHLCAHNARSHDPSREEKTLGGICACGESINPTWKELPRYSTDIAAAFEVFERAGELSYIRRIEVEVGGKLKILWDCRAFRGNVKERTIDDTAEAMAETAPLAICRALLKAALP